MSDAAGQAGVVPGAMAGKGGPVGDVDLQHVSALVDGELPREAAGPVIDRVLADSRLFAAWQDYQRVGDALRSEELLAADPRRETAAAMRFAELLATEPTVLAPHRSPLRAAPEWLRHGLSGAAVMTAVFMVGVVGWMQFSAQSGESQVLARAAATAQPGQAGQSGQVAQAGGAAAVGVTNVAGNESNKLSEYVSAHHQYSAAAWRDPGMVQAVGLQTGGPARDGR